MTWFQYLFFCGIQSLLPPTKEKLYLCDVLAFYLLLKWFSCPRCFLSIYTILTFFKVKTIKFQNCDDTSLHVVILLLKYKLVEEFVWLYVWITFSFIVVCCKYLLPLSRWAPLSHVCFGSHGLYSATRKTSRDHQIWINSPLKHTTNIWVTFAETFRFFKLFSLW